MADAVKAEEARHAALLEQQREQQRQVEERRRIWRARLWGTKRRKLVTVLVVAAPVLLILLTIATVVSHRIEAQRVLARTAQLSDTVSQDNWEEIRQLVLAGIDPNATIVERGGKPTSFLMKAIFQNNNNNDQASLDVVTWLVEHGADVSVAPGYTIAPLSAAHTPAVALLLLQHGAAVNSRTSNGETPLFFASCGPPEVVHLLIAKDAEVNAQTSSGDTPLHNAAGCGRLPIVKELIEHGADINVKNNAGKTPLAASVGHPEISSYLKARGATGEIPIQLSYLGNQLKNPTYSATFRALFNGRQDVPIWLRQFGFNGGFAGHVVVIGITKYELFALCKPHDCAGNFLHTLFLPGGRAAWALTTENRANFRFYGNPDRQLEEFLIAESRRNSRGEW